MYAALIAKRKLCHYFEVHTVTVVTSFPLGEVVQNRDAMGRITKWALELMGLGISYGPSGYGIFAHQCDQSFSRTRAF